MSHHVRDRLAYRRPLFMGTVTESDPHIEAVRAALVGVAAKARADFPDEYKRVDRILSRLNRSLQHMQPFDYDGPVLECRWCGNDFPPDANSVFCKDECHDDHREWNAKRRNLKRRRAYRKQANQRKASNGT